MGKKINGMLSCPFCGNHGQVHKYHDKVFAVHCTGKYCSVETGNSVSEEGAKKIWNRRRDPEIINLLRLIQKMLLTFDEVENPLIPKTTKKEANKILYKYGFIRK